RLLPKTDDKAASPTLASWDVAAHSECPCLALPGAERLESARHPCRRDAACHHPSVRPDAAAYRRAAASSVSPSVPVAAWQDAAAPSALLGASASWSAPSPERPSWLWFSSRQLFSPALCAWRISSLPVSSLRLCALPASSPLLSALPSSSRRASPPRSYPNPSSCLLYVSSQSLSSPWLCSASAYRRVHPPRPDAHLYSSPSCTKLALPGRVNIFFIIRRMQMKVAWSDVNSSRIAIGTHDQRRTAS